MDIACPPYKHPSPIIKHRSFHHKNAIKDDHRLVLARGKRLLPFDQYRCKTEAITDDFAVTCASFNRTSLTILTATERTVKVR